MMARLTERKREPERDDRDREQPGIDHAAGSPDPHARAGQRRQRDRGCSQDQHRTRGIRSRDEGGDDDGHGPNGHAQARRALSKEPLPLAQHRNGRNEPDDDEGSAAVPRGHNGDRNQREAGDRARAKIAPAAFYRGASEHR